MGGIQLASAGARILSVQENIPLLSSLLFSFPHVPHKSVLVVVLFRADLGWVCGMHGKKREEGNPTAKAEILSLAEALHWVLPYVFI